MKSNTSTQSATLLGAALAGISGLSAPAQAATIYDDTAPGADLNDGVIIPTDLSGVFSNFRIMGKVVGGFSGTAPDFRDHFLVGAEAGESYSIPFSYEDAGSPLSVRLSWQTESGPQTIQTFPFAVGSGDTTLDFTLDAILPPDASEEITFIISYGEGGTGRMTYEIGSVPDPSSTALLGLGLMGAAMRRKRD